MDEDTCTIAISQRSTGDIGTSHPGEGGGRLGSILDGMCEHNFEGNGSFFSFKRMA